MQSKWIKDLEKPKHILQRNVKAITSRKILFYFILSDSMIYMHNQYISIIEDLHCSKEEQEDSRLFSTCNYLSHALQRRPGVKLGQRASWGHQGCTEKWPPEWDHKQTLPIPLVNKKWMNKELNNLHTCNVNNVQFYYLIFTCNSDWPSFSRYHVLNRPINFSTLLSLATCQRSLAYKTHNDAVKINQRQATK